jgi:diguanylate cyclase (GGDEF)-like protein
VLDPLRTMTQTEWEQWSKSKTGKRYAARINVSVVRDGDGHVQQYAAIISDITQRKLDEEKILYQANYDQLTGLANRTLFLDRLNRLVVESRRAKTNVGLMFIDLDGFKAINDNLGHDAGDLLLKGTARRLEKCVRETDTVARLGGDEFTVIMPLIESLEAAAMVADRIIRSLSEVFDLDGKSGRVSASIGISILPGQAPDASTLLHNADVAMYHAKRQGKANYQFFAPELEVRPDQAARL